MKKHVIFWTVVVLIAVMPALAGAAEKEKSEKKLHPDFMKKAAQANVFEVKAGEVAAKRASDPQVKEFATRMVNDHTKVNDELRSIAEKENVQLPTEMNKKHKKHLEALEKAKENNFDLEYMNMMVKDHEKDVEEFRNVKKAGGDPEVTAWVEKTLPVLEEHLQMAKDIDKRLKSAKK